MKRNSVFVVITFLAGIAVGFGGRSARVLAMPQSDTRASDLAAIEKLHQEDIEVTLSQDEKGLIDIWADDAVRFNPPELPAVGKQAIATFKSRTAWHASGSNVNPNLNCLQILRLPAGMRKDFRW